MAIDGVRILDSDFALDVYDDFFERYDRLEAPAAIAVALTREYAAEILSPVDEEIFLTALAECLWSVGGSVDALGPRIRDLLEAGTNAAFWGEVYVARTAALRRFLRKIAAPKKSPVRPKKTRLPKRLPFAAGDFLAFEKKNGKCVPAVVWMIETRGILRYDFVFPNLSAATDGNLVGRLLHATDTLSEDDLCLLFNPRRRVPVTTIEHACIKKYVDRFRRFGNRPFRFPQWQGGSFGYCVTFEDFEKVADQRGSRAFTEEELQSIARDGLPPEKDHGTSSSGG